MLNEITACALLSAQSTTHMKLTAQQQEQLLDALDLLKQADAEDIHAVIDAHDGEDERLNTIINLRGALEESIARLEDDLSDEIAYYEGEALDTAAYDADTLEKYRRFALHSRATQYLARSQAETNAHTRKETEELIDNLIKEQGGSLYNNTKYEAAIDALIEHHLNQ